MGVVCITGATGFVGRRLWERLHGSNAEVVRVGRSLAEGSLFDLVEALERAGSLSRADTVIHLAALVHEPSATWRDLLRSNFAATVSLARRSAAIGVRRFVFLSTAGVYAPSTRPLVEDYVVRPRNDYSQSKALAEAGLRGVAEATGLHVVVLRPPLVYGHNAPGSLDQLQRLLDRGVPLPLGRLKEHRSVISVENLVATIIRVIDDKAAPPSALEVFNAAEGEPTVTEFVKYIKGGDCQ